MSYGPSYEDDNATDRKGECRREIHEVRRRINEDVDPIINKTFNDWRDHEAVKGKDATLVVLGYGEFFGLSEECDKWSFGVFWALFKPKIVMEMRKEFNDIVSEWSITS